METTENMYRVLLGDSHGGDAALLKSALCCCDSFGLAHQVSTIADLVSYLAGTGKFVDREEFPEPTVVLLDLNLSGPCSGFEVLKWIQSQATRLFRVVVLSSTAREDECEQAYALGADGFVTKPRSVAEMITILTRIEGWLRTSTPEEANDFCVA